MAKFYDPETVLINLKGGAGFRFIDAQSGTLVLGRSGSGKTSGPSRLLIESFLKNDMGGIVLFAKNGEANDWIKACKKAGRESDVIRIHAGGPHKFNFLNWIAQMGGAGERGPHATVSLLEEIASASESNSGSSKDDNAFFLGAFRTLLFNLVSIIQLSGLVVSIPLMRRIVASAPDTIAQVNDPEWRRQSICSHVLREAKAQTQSDAAARADYEECKTFFTQDWVKLSDKTKGVVLIYFSNLARPFLTRPLRELFCSETNYSIEQAFDGRVFLIDIPVQEFGVVGRMAAVTIKRCFQLALMRRSGPPGSIRPSFLHADECQLFLTALDADFQAVARSAGGVTVYLTQQMSSIRDAMGSDDKAENLISNLANKFLCQGSGETAEWASKLIGERYIQIASINVGRGGSEGSELGGATSHAGLTRSESLRRYVEPSAFQKLRFGGEANDYLVDAIFFSAGHFFAGDNGERLPYKYLSFKQR